MEPEPKTVAETALSTIRLMMPMDANPAGNVFGGVIMKYMDEIAGIVAFRHAGRNCVTAAIDWMNFYAPVHIGDLLIMKASVNYMGKASMEVGVRIESQDPLTKKITHTGSCHLIFVAVDENGKPTELPKVIPITAEEKRRYEEAQERRKLRVRESIWEHED